MTVGVALVVSNEQQVMSFFIARLASQCLLCSFYSFPEGV